MTEGAIGRQTQEKKLHVFVLLSIIVLTFIIYFSRLFSLQVIEGETYRTRSRTISSQVNTLSAHRGEIFDRNFTSPFVTNTDSFAVNITPAEIPIDLYDTVTARLSHYLGIPKSEIDRRIPSNMRRSFTSVEIRSNVSFNIITNIAENITDLPGVSWVSKPMRNYIYTGSLSHVIGYVGNITKEEMTVMYNKGYKPNSIVGKTGIERQYDDLLQGVPGREMKTVDVRGRILSDEPVIEPPQMGKNLVLTIDRTIQTLAEKALGNRVGAAIVLKADTGEILAMVSYPYFDSNIFNTENSNAEYVKLMQNDNNPLLNRAVNATYPPASTFKVIMSAALLSEGTFPEDKKIECKGKMSYGGRVFHCWQHEPGHGHLDLREALAQSCDIYYWTVGRDFLGVDSISYYAKEFGLGQDTKIDLPSRANGFIPSAQWKERRYHEKWVGGDTMAISIGQGYTLVTPLQLANMMAMVANKGTIYQPHLLKEIRNPVNGEVISEVNPKVLFHSDSIPEEVWKKVQDDLRYTITDGSGKYPMANKVVQIAGKTGTAEVSDVKKENWHSWLVAYAPYDKPAEERIVVVVLVEAVNAWEWWAPYATNIIFQGIFANQSYDEAVDALGFRALIK
ncbi:penicillin-binding protein 2 [Treponema parvum]|uniref:Penicillin-binding protein 2 n=1 Tax=Treponema parvum TaxID=138851 RepID=A0A975EZN1_9SPIR|nr:penicillin-binding protein 2 [Treponema parvum]QTQ11876.1 penicillin-binding protein 2 [Treponema parvum]